MTLKRKSERFNISLVLFNDQSLSLRNNSSHHILSFKFSPNEIRRAIGLNSPMSINFSNKRNLSFSNGNMKMTRGVDICIKGESFWQTSEMFPSSISEYPWESCTVFFLSKSPMRFLVMIITQKAFAGSSNNSKSWAVMSPKYPFLPEFIKTLNRGISPRFSLWNENQMDAQEQMKTNNLGETKGIASASCGSHLIIQLRYPGYSHRSPGFNQMSAQRDGLFIRKLARKRCVSRNIHRMKRIESGNTLCPSKISWPHKVCLVKFSHLLGLHVRIRRFGVISLRFLSSSLPVTKENSGNSRNRRNLSHPSLCEFPMDCFSSNSRESRTTSLMRLQFFSDSENLFDQVIRGFSPNSFGNTTFIFKPLKPFFFVSLKPFGEPASASSNQSNDIFETMSFFIKVYCFAAYAIFILMFHRLSFSKIIFGKSLGDTELVYDVMIFFKFTML